LALVVPYRTLFKSVSLCEPRPPRAQTQHGCFRSFILSLLSLRLLWCRNTGWICGLCLRALCGSSVMANSTRRRPASEPFFVLALLLASRGLPDWIKFDRSDGTRAIPRGVLFQFPCGEDRINFASLRDLHRGLVRLSVPL